MKKLAAALLSGTMLLGMTGSVFAADAQTDAMSVSVTANDTSAVLTKTWTAAENGLLKDGEKFTFRLTYDSVEAVSTNVPASPQYMNQLLSAGIAVDTTLSAQWKTRAAGGNTSSATKSYVDLFNGISFTTPGTYHFILSENEGTNPNISYDTATYEIIVQVVWKDNFEGLKINGVSTAQGKNKLDGAAFENNAAANKILTVSKKVGGGAANKKDDFTFKVTITGIDGTYSTNVAGKTITNGTETEFTLRHGETFVVKNLPKNASYTVVETDKKGYQKTEVSVNKEANQTSDTAEGTIRMDGENTVDYTNTKTVPSPTGIALEILPFAVLFLAAIAGGVVFFRRKRG